jgi:hypothetical protein
VPTPVLSLPPRTVFDALSRSHVLAVNGETLPDELAERLTALRAELAGADSLTDAIAREHVARYLKSLGYLNPDRLLAAALGRAPVVRPAELVGPDELPLTLRLAEIIRRPELIRPPRVVVPRLAWRGCSSLLAWREKRGKSTLAAAGAAAVTRGARFLDGTAPAGSVLWYSADLEPWYVLANRFERFGADLERVHAVTRLLASPLELLPVLADLKPDLLVVDTLASAVSGAVQDSGEAAQWLPFLLPLRDASRRLDLAVVLIHHATKAEGRYRDSTAIGAAVDVLLELEADEPSAEMRRVRAVGRWLMPNFGLRLAGDRFTLDAGLPALDAQVFGAIVAEPGLSGHKVRQKIPGRDADVVASLKRLASDGLIANQGTLRVPKWHPAASTPASVVPVVPDAPEQPCRGVVPEPHVVGGSAQPTPDTPEPSDREQPAEFGQWIP